MKLREEVIIAPNNDEAIMADASGKFKGMVKLNETAAFIANLFYEDISEEEAVARLISEYECSIDQAKEAVKFTIEKIKEAGLFE
ncbi:MAG: PqqD family protein [Bacilli bacterium]|nr:PqqD family protein [Bacilli bacterium]